MPGGSAYPGPPDALEQYAAVVDRSSADVAVKGAKNPYATCNGHMFSFLDAEGVKALRLSDELRETDEIAAWFDRSHEWVGTLEPK